MTISLENRAALQQTMQLRQLLIVDDEQVIRELCTEALSDYKVTQASSAEEALKQMEQRPFDLVITDVLMQGMDGIALLQKIKRHSPDIPVIVMTGFTDRETVLRALQAGADDFIDKPVNLLELCTTVNRALERKQLADQVHQLHHLDRLHNQFLGLISHKLKTPVTAISLILQNLRQDTDPESQQTLQMALNEVTHLGNLIEDLLFFSDTLLDTTPQASQPVELPRLMIQVAGSLEKSAEEKQIILETDLDGETPPLAVDRERVRFAFRAILENAIKFSPAGQTIQVRCALSNNHLELRVRDRGPGIPGEEKARVFDRFYQIDPSKSGQVRGFGLGLYYAREFVQRHGGELQLHSCEGEGTTALLRFPLPTP